jgi:thioredoxin-like negative regulator of GroEL
MLDSDPELERIRRAKLAEMKAQFDSRLELKAKGHGELREIVQDEFLPEVTKTRKCLVHFFHKDFEKCKIIDHHLKILAPQYMECKFLCMNAEKCPFFVEKLQVQILPTIICFFDGVVVDKVIGFEGLGKNLPEDRIDEFPTRDLARRLGEGESSIFPISKPLSPSEKLFYFLPYFLPAKDSVITYVAPPSEKELEDFGLSRNGGRSIRQSTLSNHLDDDE